MKLAALLLVTSAAAHAQLPWTNSTLPNGARLVIVEKRGLPIVRVTITFTGGTHQFEPRDKLGVANFAAAMLLDGAQTSSEANIGGESGTISVATFSDKLQPTLERLADALRRPTFSSDALERLRARRLVQMKQASDDPASLAEGVLNKLLYGDRHPYGMRANEESIRAVTPDDVASFASDYFTPRRALIVIVGELEPAAARAALERTLGNWWGGGERPSFEYPPPPAAAGTTIYVVDRPNATQSELLVGALGPPRHTPDFYALEVLNAILGGEHHSRLNQTLREVKGYSYGVRSSFSYGRGPGAFVAGGSVTATKTDSALIEVMRVLGDRTFSDAEVEWAKQSLTLKVPQRFATTAGISSAIAEVYEQGLPQSYYRDYPDSVNAVTRGDVQRVATKYVDVEHLNIVVVGDRSVIEEPLRRAAIAPVVLLETEQP